MAKETDEIIAAGGLVVQPVDGHRGSDASRESDSAETQATAPGRRQVLLVHRPKYNDWSFPKGKADPGETIEQTALREVCEETGLDCGIIQPLSIVRYTYGKASNPKPKVVHYFLMEPRRGELQLNGYEIDQAEWLDPQRALRRLTYDHDRKLLSDALEAGLI
jgi:8-oxo-dGTP diphosphatase